MSKYILISKFFSMMFFVFQAHTALASGHNLDSPLIFDFPVTYNDEVSKWIRFYQGSGRSTFKNWLERSSKYFPMIQAELSHAGLPKDLSYMVMIESGFAARAVSPADAVGPWQFMQATGARYGLHSNWWLDERRDFKKSTNAAVKYMRALHDEFGSWYLVAASYNMGEGGLRRILNKYHTKDYWKLIALKALPQETRDYVPRLIAAILIAKAPGLYGFRNLNLLDPIPHQMIPVPGGTSLDQLADYLSVTRKSLRDMNAELKLGVVPKNVPVHLIRIPTGSYLLVKRYIQSAFNQEELAME